MRRLLNTLFVTTENAYLFLDGENVVVKADEEILGRFPLHILEGIILFSYSGASPGLMGKCAEQGTDLVLCSPNGKFLARTTGSNNGNVLLRRTQYRVADDEERSLQIAKNMILGKLYNGRWSIERSRRDHRLRIDEVRLAHISDTLKNLQSAVLEVKSLDSLRGVEGTAASVYFSAFDELILQDKVHFFFNERSRRPPLDRVNALLSFSYSLLTWMCASALESVGLDAYVGFLHTDRPGRVSLALDLMEELRPCFADRFTLTLINNRVIQSDDFIADEAGAFRLTDDARKRFLKAWQERKQETITHPFLQEKIQWGLVPYVQALLLARFLRGDLDAYPTFLWK